MKKLKLSDDGIEVEEDITPPAAGGAFFMGVTAVPNADGGQPQLWVARTSHYPDAGGYLQYSPDGGKSWIFQLNGTNQTESWRRISFVGDMRRPGVAFPC